MSLTSNNVIDDNIYNVSITCSIHFFFSISSEFYFLCSTEEKLQGTFLYWIFSFIRHYCGISICFTFLSSLEPFGLFWQNLAQLNHSLMKRFHVCMCIYKGSSFFKGESILTFRFFKVMTFHFFSEQKIFWLNTFVYCCRYCLSGEEFDQWISGFFFFFRSNSSSIVHSSCDVQLLGLWA